MFMPRSTEGMSLEEKVDLLMSEREIRDVIYRDCRAKSRCDVDLMKSCFYPEAVDYHQPFFTLPVKDLFDHFAKWSPYSAEMVEYFTTQVLIDIQGDVAHVESYQMSAKVFHERTEGGNQQIRLSGHRNLDRFERRDGSWRIAERRFIPEWGFFKEVPPLERSISSYGPGTEANRVFAARANEQTADPESPGTIAFTRDPTDPSYHF